MAQNENLGKFVIGILIIGLTLVFGIFIASTLSGSFDTVATSQSASENGYANLTGFTVSHSTDREFSGSAVTALTNLTDTGVSSDEAGSANLTTYTLARSTIIGFSTPSITSIVNTTSGTLVTSGNYTLTGNVLTNRTVVQWPLLSINYTYTLVIGAGNATISSAGVVTNNTPIQWKSTGITYSYTNSSDTAASSASNSLVSALNGGTAWITILVVVGFAVIVLGMLSEGLGKAAKGTGNGPVY